MSKFENRKTAFEILENSDMPSRIVPAGEVILSQGSESKEMFIVRSGRAAISVNGETVEEVGPGGIFGEMGLIDYESRSATVTAIEECDLLPIDERTFVILVQDTPYFALDVMATLVSRIRALNETLK